MTQEQPQCAANCLISLWPRSSFLSAFFQVFGWDLFSLSALFKGLLYAWCPFSRCAAICDLLPPSPSRSLSHSTSLAHSICPHSSPELPSRLSLTHPITPSHTPSPLHSNFHERSLPWTEDILRHAPQPRNMCMTDRNVGPGLWSGLRLD